MAFRPSMALLLTPVLACGPVFSQEPPPGQPTSVTAQRDGWASKATGPGRAWKELDLVGVAKRQRGGVDFYTLALYMDVKAMRAKAGDGPWTPDTLAHVLSEGGVPHAFHAKFLREVGGMARRKFLAEALSAHWPGKRFPEHEPRYQPFLAYFGLTIRKGEITEIWVDGQGGMALVYPEPAPVRIQDRTLEKALVDSYFLDPAKDRSMGQELLRDLPTLLAALPAPRKPPRR